MALDNVTALICAYNASNTIKRAILSVMDQVVEVVIVNDGSSDDTVDVIEALNATKINLIKSHPNKGIGASRQRALEACQTEYAIWVDADDECLPNRVATLLPYLEQGAGWVYDSVELYDGQTGKFNKNLIIPDFLLETDGLLHQIARNYIPSIGFPMINVKQALAIGFDTSFRHGEDYDHFLRALTSGGKISLSPAITHRMYDLPFSLSRQLTAQNEYVELGMKKHKVDDLANILNGSCLDAKDQLSILLLRLLKIKDAEGLEKIISTIDLSSGDYEFDWLVHFSSGIFNYLQGRFLLAKKAFQNALSINKTADICNNLGVLNEHLGVSGKGYYEEALELFPGYQDAERNFCGAEMRITYVPLRKGQSRDIYRG